MNQTKEDAREQTLLATHLKLLVLSETLIN